MNIPIQEVDFLFWLNNSINAILACKPNSPEYQHKISNLNAPAQWLTLKTNLFAIVNENGHCTDTRLWHHLCDKLKIAAKLQKQLHTDNPASSDAFHTYAELYDEVIGKPCLHEFIGRYIAFVLQRYPMNLDTAKFLSIGCGTGLVEQHILQTTKLKHTNLSAIDISESMVIEAAKRVQASVCDFLAMQTNNKQWDLTYSGLNVFQYLSINEFERAVKRTAKITCNNGLFFGDFITPDHIRWYPNVIQSESVISLRQPMLTVQAEHPHQQSEIINVSKMSGQLRITYEGKHLRCLPSVIKMRQLFCKYFNGGVDFYDAVSLQPLTATGETTESTRLLIVARKGY